MNDLQTRITEHVDSTAPPIDIDLLVEQLTHDEAPTRRLRSDRALLRFRQPRWAPILAGGIVVLILIGGVALLTGRIETPVITVPDATTPTPAIPSPTTVPSAPLVETPATGPWTNHEIVGNSVIGDDLVAGWITSGGPGFVATGNTYTGGDVWGRGQIWTSTDGSSWTWVADDDRALFVEGYWPSGVLGADAGFIVWGTNNRQGGTVIWHSSNGTDWSLVTTGEPPLADDYVTEGVALASGGYLLYGASANCSVEAGTCSRPSTPRLFKSSDGFAWEEIATPVTFTAITETDTGDLLAAQRRGQRADDLDLPRRGPHLAASWTRPLDRAVPALGRSVDDGGNTLRTDRGRSRRRQATDVVDIRGRQDLHPHPRLAKRC